MNLQVQTVTKRYTFYNVKIFQIGVEITVFEFTDGKKPDQLKTKDIISILNRTEYD